MVNSLTRLVCGGIVIGSVLLGCASSKEQQKYYYSIPLSQIPSKPIHEQRQEQLDEIVANFDLKNTADVIYYHESNIDRFCDVFGQEYDSTIEQSETLWFDFRQRFVNGPEQLKIPFTVLLPRESIGTGKKSIAIIFDPFYDLVETSEDVRSYVVDNIGFQCADNANGVIINSTKIIPSKMLNQDPMNFADIRKLRGYSNQLKVVEKDERKISAVCNKGLVFAYVDNFALVGESAREDPMSALALNNTPYIPFPRFDMPGFRLFREEDQELLKQHLEQFFKQFE